MKTRKWITLFILLLSAMLAAAQPPAPQPVTDLVIQVSDNLNDIVLNWSRPQYADSFQVYAGDSSDFQVGVMTRIGTTPDTTFIHVNGLMGAQKRFYAVVAIAGPAGMVLVPAGLYDMGATYQSWAQPIHTVNVPAFYMDRYEVTNAQYKAFCDATSRTYPDDPSSGFYTPPYFTNPVYANYPVVMVDWNDARAYAAWAGKRLPSEAEWERAAKGNTDNRQWPWGDTWVDANANILDNPADGYTYTSPVGNYPSGISPTGCFDMAGNVYEWCEDDGHASYNGAPTNGSAWIDNPRGSARVLRGGSWRLNSSGARCAYRGDMDPAGRNSSVGFRCSKSFVNQPPQVPSSPSPADSAIGQSVDVNLSWTCSDPDLDPLTYDVYFGTASTPPLVNSGQTAVTYDPGTLADITAYYWRIVAHDNHDSTSGPVWSFTTEGFAGMVLIPAGLYDMGATYQSWAQPIHTVNVPAFYMDRYEVTNAQYKAFCDATSRAYPLDPGFYADYFTNPVYANYPVVMVEWYDARAYAEWAGKRLPTEAEWERAAKGNTDNRQWPWGDTWVAANANITNNPADGYTYTSPVGNYPNGISPAGCNDMAGNVLEWGEDDWHDNYTGAPTDGSAWIDNPRGSFRVFRGGSWGETDSDARCANRSYTIPAIRFSLIGFRCSKSYVNQPPQVPSSPAPADSAIGQSVDVDLSWTCSDPDLDPLTYDVYFDTTSSPPLVNSGQTAVTYDPGTLASGTTYFWRIVAHDNHGHSADGPVWSFTTEGFAGMVLVPAGSFVMGSTVVGGYSIPEHTVNVPAFYMDIYEVTNAQYKAFCDATSRVYPPNPSYYTNYFTDPAYVNYPVVNVTWYDAGAYAAWAGKRLPREAEWERAAKGNTDNRQWPWGDTWVAANANIWDNPADGYTYTAPVGNYPNGISPAGCFDMAGNVYEWCEDDWHSNYTGAPADGSAWIDSPRGSFRVVRGGSWDGDNTSTRCAGRGSGYPPGRYYIIGFRCARTP